MGEAGETKERRTIDDGRAREQSSDEEDELNDFDYSSGIESGQDEDIMLEQELMDEIKKKK